MGNKDNKYTSFRVVGKTTDSYQIFDLRARKPVCFMKDNNEENLIILQEMDKIEKKEKKTKSKEVLEYFAPNNVGILLSITSKAKKEAKEIYIKEIPKLYQEENSSDVNTVISNSIKVYDYMEKIQTAIVFSYTALETFTNLSIPDNYVYRKEIHNKGIVEEYDKIAIERYVNLKDKISIILKNIYQTPDFKGKSIWNDFIQLENLRHEIIHQKSIEITESYKNYVNEDIFKLLDVAEKIIKYFFDYRKDKGKTSLMWPWIINTSNDFLIQMDEEKKISVYINKHIKPFEK